MKKEYVLVLDRTNIEEYTGYLESVHEIPCDHVVSCYIESSYAIKVESFAK